MTALSSRYFPIDLLDVSPEETTDGNDVVAIRDGDVFFGSFDGRAGIDTLQLNGGNSFDFTTTLVFQNFEILRGSESADTIILGESQLAGITTIDGVANSSTSSDYWNFLRLKGLSLDLRNISILNMKSILLEEESDNAVVMVDNHDTAIRLDGTAVQNDHLILHGVTLTSAEISKLHRQGIDRISDANGTLISLDSAPVVTGLSGDRAVLNQQGTALIDVNGDAVITDEGPISFIEIDPVGDVGGGMARLTATDRVSFSENEDGNGLIFVDKVAVGNYLTYEASILIKFYNSATHQQVSHILHSIAYMDDPSAFGTSKSVDVAISIVDQGGRRTEITVMVAGTPDTPLPPTTLDMNRDLVGTRGSDRLVGGSGDDTLRGKLGNDVLVGGAGKDIFVFDTKPGKKNIDKIVDFNAADDSIHLENAIFKKLGKKTGVLKKAAFWSGSKAHDASDRIIYDKKKGILYYDEDGSGSKSAVKFATINKTPLTEKDFIII